MTCLLANMALHCTNTMVMKFASVTLWLYTFVLVAIDYRVYFRSFLSLGRLLGMRVDETKNDTILGVGLSPNLCIL